MTPIITTGLNGLVGSRFKHDFEQIYSLTNLDISNAQNPVDITNKEQVLQAFENQDAPFVIHFAAYTDVTGAWKQRDDKTGLAYKVNVLGTEHIVEACQRTGKHLIHISTAYVFDGTKSGMYTETDTPNPIEWYGYTKAEAEQRVQASNCNWTILRIDQPFRSDTVARPDIVRRIADGLRSNTLYPQFTNHFFAPTYINDLSLVLDWVIRTKTTGIFHATTNEQWTDYDFAIAVRDSCNLSGTIQRGDLNAYLETLDRPYQQNTALGSNKLQKQLDFTLKTVPEALKEVTL